MTLNRVIHSLTDLATGTLAAGKTVVYDGSQWEIVPGGTVNVFSYGAVGDGVANDSTAIQAAIDAANAASGGVVLCPPGTYKCNVTLKAGVVLVGAAEGPGNLASFSTLKATTFVGAATGIVIDTPVAETAHCGVYGINVQGLGAATAMTGIRLRDVNRGFVKNVSFDNFADEGLLVDSTSNICSFENILALRCVLNRTRSAVIGAVDIAGTDHHAFWIESTISGSIEGTVQSASLFCVGIAWKASTSFVSALAGEISDVGVRVTGSHNRFSNCRADLNYGHGWMIEGGSNQFTNCEGLSNSQDTTNTYDNWHATAASGNNLFMGCMAKNLAAKVTRYGFNDLQAGAANKNHYVNPYSSGSTTAQYNAAANNGSTFSWPMGAAKVLTANSATPDVTAYELFQTANTSATTITNFTGGVPGQRLVIFCNDSNTTIQHNGSTLFLAAPGNKTLRSGSYYEFVAHGGGTAWREVAALPLGVSADNGDAAKTIQARVAEETQRWNTPLTTDRAVTLSTTGAFNGATFRIVRTAAATGAFNLNVGTGPLKALTAGQWCDVAYDGSAWLLTAFGSL